MNQMGASIKYPYHDLPLKSTHDRLGYWALLGILEDMYAKMSEAQSPSGKKGMTFTLDCGKPPDKRKR